MSNNGITPDPNGSVIAPKVRAISDELNAQFLERGDLVRCTLLGIFSDSSIFVLGPPGTGKSYFCDRVASRIKGARYFGIQLNPQLPPEDLFGPLDLTELKQGNRVRDITGYAGDAHVLNFDEIGKAGPAVTNLMLELINEHRMKQGGHYIDTPTLITLAASNELLDMESGMGAAWDRFILRLEAKPMVQRQNFIELITTGAPAPKNPTQITLKEVEAARKEVIDINLPQSIAERIAELRDGLFEDGIQPSDRRMMKLVHVCKAAAWLEGRDSVDEDDLAVMRFGLWDEVEQRKAVEGRVLSLTSKFTAAAVEHDTAMDEFEQQLNEVGNLDRGARANVGTELNLKAEDVSTALADLLEEAKREGRSTQRIDEALDRARSIRARILVECLGVGSEAARKAVS